MVLSSELECIGCGFGNSTTEDNAVVPSLDLRGYSQSQYRSVFYHLRRLTTISKEKFQQ
jgi:hypothetical protein